jgi:type II secretory pathway component GspD/PulD (secretin)
LRFSFRHARWIDVLEWLAKQSDLSLVLDAPPPGSFNYSDSREYTPLEAIDLVNEVLASKGYTLVRRGRMLTVVGLAGGVPRDLLPRVKLAELGDRGKFEMVSVAFPVGRRKIEAVTAEIQVLLGSYGQVAPLPASGQILVTDRAGIMRMIGAVIESIPETKSSRKPSAKTPEKPELGVYALGGSNPTTAVETLKALFENARFVYDPETDHIHAFATPTQHAAIAQVFEQMGSGVSGGNRPRLEVYPLPGFDPVARKEVLSNLAIVAPDARLRYDEQAERLFVWAKPVRQDAIRDSIVKLLQVVPPRGTRALRVYTLKRTDLTTLSTLLQTTLPRARITVDLPGHRLIVHASQQDQQTVAQLVEQMDAEPAEDRRAVLRIYPVDRRLASRLTPLLIQLVPEAKATIDPKLGRVSVVATPGDHEQVESILTRLTEGSASLPRHTVEVVKVPKELRERFEAIRTLLTAEIPEAKLIWNSELLELTVWALAEDHARIREVLAQVAKQPAAVPPRPTVIVHTLPKALRDRYESVQTLLTAQIPKAKLIWDPESLELTVWALPDDHLRVGELLEQIGRHPPMEKQRHLAAYPVAMADLTMAVTMLQNVADEARITSDPKGRRILVWATAEEQEAIEKAIRAMGGNDAIQGARSYLSHPVRGLDLALATRLLIERLPGITFEPDRPRSALIALATPSDHEQIDKILQEMRTAPQTDDSRPVVVYPTSARESETVAQVLSELLPEAQVVGKRYVPNVSVRGTDEEQRLAKEVVDQWIENTKRPTRMEAKRYALKMARASDLLPQLQRLVRTAVFVQGPSPHAFLVRAKAEDHELLEKLIQELDQPVSDDRVVEVYELPGGNITSLRGLLDAKTVAQIQVAPAGRDRVIVRATPEVQEEIKAVVDKIGPAMDVRPRMVSYPLEHADPQNAWTVLRAIVPRAVMVVQPKSKSLAVSAVDEDHRRIADALREIDRPGNQDNQKVSVIPIVEAEPQTLLRLLQTKYAGEADLTFSYDTGTRSILVVGPAERHEEINKIVAAADSADSGLVQRVVVYPLGRINGYIAQRMAYQLMAKERIPVTLTYEPGGNHLVVVAHDRQQAVIRDALEQLQPPETDFAVFALQQLDPLIAEDAVIGLFAGALKGGSAPAIDADRDNNRLYVRATPEQLAKIRDLLTKMGERQLDATDHRPNQAKLRFVPLSGDEQEAIESIRAIWSTLRNNDLRVLDREQTPDTFPREPAATPLRDRNGPTPKSPPPEVPGHSSGPRKTEPAIGRVGTRLWEALLGAHPLGLIGQVTTGPVTPPPVYIVPGKRGVTIMSEDTEALDQLEHLLSVVAQPQSRGSRRFFVYQLKSSIAPRLADTLNKLYRYIPSSGRGRTTFVADERLNALVIFASRSDRQEIEGLLEILDVEQTPDMQATHRPVVIPLRHARAVTVEKQLRLLYKTQLMAGGKQPTMEIPSGADATVAAMIEQINAIRQGPLMTLGTDEETNSILVVAPPSLIEEVRRFTEELDQAAGEHPRRAVRIVPLKKTNAAEIDRALKRILRNRRRR